MGMIALRLLGSHEKSRNNMKLASFHGINEFFLLQNIVVSRFALENWRAGDWIRHHWRKEDEGSIFGAAVAVSHHRRPGRRRRCV